MSSWSLRPGPVRQAAVLAAAAILAGGCDDDPARPGGGGPVWTQVELPAVQGDLTLLAAAARGPRAMALGYLEPPARDKAGEGESILLELQADGTWDLHPLPGGSITAVWLGLALAEDGQPVLAGFDLQGEAPGGCILDTRQEQVVQHPFGGFGLMALDAEGQVMTAGGSAAGGRSVTSTAPQTWISDPLPLSEADEAGLLDVDIRGGMAAACGFDDGADVPQVLLLRQGTGDWQLADLGGLTTFSRTFTAVALGDDGAVFVGGIAGAGGSHPTAFLSVRSSAGDWADIVLPNPTQLGRVNDILVAADGSVYLACSGEDDLPTAHIVRASGVGPVEEIAPFPGELNALTQDGDGTIWAAGTRMQAGSPVRQGMLLRRRD